MNLTLIESDVYKAVGEKKGQSRHSSTDVQNAINNVYKEVCKAKDFRFSLKEKSILIPVTTLSASASAGTTSVSITSASSFGKNRRVLISDGSNYEYKTISSLSGTTVTLDSALENAFASGSYFIMDIFFLPLEVGLLQNVRAWEDTKRTLKLHRQFLADLDYPKRESLADTPTDLYFTGVDNSSEGSMTAKATTNTLQITSTGLVNATNDYYNGWKVINETRKLSARITDYVATTGILTLESPITAQAADDVFHIEPHLMGCFLYPSLNESRYLHLTFRQNPTRLVNDYDEPIIEPEEFQNILVYGAARDLYRLDPKNPNAVKMAEYYGVLYKQRLDRLFDVARSAEGEFQKMRRAT